ncbi:MAG: molecular chaperone GroES, partial [Frankiales bacterium]|nr:molecular chaperone GroES [Frankiales bacterium]
MFAAYAASLNANEPLSALALGERPEPVEKEGWSVVEVKAASLNHHDLWTLRGVGITEAALPMILGCDAAG